MRQRLVLFSAIVLLLLSGCSDKKPKPKSNANTHATNNLVRETVTINESSVNSKSRYNGSSDGMKSIYFDFAHYGISPDARSIISFNVSVLNQKLQGKRVKLEGNCDEFGTDEYNFALGLKRAKAVKDALQVQGIKSNQIILISYGESNPRCHDVTDSCYRQNRRVDLHLVR